MTLMMGSEDNKLGGMEKAKTGDEQAALANMVRSLSEATLDEAAVVLAQLKGQADTLRAAGQEAEADQIENLVKTMAQMKARAVATSNTEEDKSVPVAEQEEEAPVAPVDFNCDRWRGEWEAVRVANSTPRDIWEQMTQKLAAAEHEHEKKIGALRKVSRDWINKVKADMSRTEEEHEKRISVLQRVAKQWEADSSEQIEKLQMDVAEARSAQSVSEAAATTLQTRVQNLEKGAGLEQMRAEMSALEAKLEQVATENVHMEIAAEQHQASAAQQLSAQAAAHEAILAQEKEATQKVTAEKEELELRTTAYNGLCTEMTLKVDHLEAQLKASQAAVDTMNARFGDEVAAAVAEELAAMKK